jgi:hypothetical protein
MKTSSWNWKTMRRYVDRDAMLRTMGLEQRSPAGDFFTGLGLFSIGVLVGAGLGLMFAPSRGNEMRQRMGEKWKSRRGQYDQRDLGLEGGMPPAPGTTAAGPSH